MRETVVGGSGVVRIILGSRVFRPPTLGSVQFSGPIMPKNCPEILQTPQIDFLEDNYPETVAQSRF